MPADSNPFRKPSGGGIPARGDASAFLSRDFSPPAPVLEPSGGAAPAPDPLAEPASGRPQKTKERKVPITYKHHERNFTILKKLAHRLDVAIGDLLDEALEAKFPEWKAKAAELPPDDF